MSSTPQKRLIQRFASRIAAFFGVRFYNLLYGEKNLLQEIEAVSTTPEVRVDRARENDVEDLLNRLPVEQRGYCLTAKELGSECWIAWHGEEIAGYSWLNFEQVNLLGWRLFDLPESGAYTYNSYVMQEYRGRRIFQRLTETVYRHIRDEGFAFCGNLVDRSNAASIGARRRFGLIYQPAPVLKIPGRGPFILGRKPELGVSLKAQLTASTGQSSSAKRI